MLTMLSARLGLAALLALFIAGLVAQEPLGATFAAADVYRLPAGVVIPTDLYVIANEAVIEGEVQGHVAVIARRVRVSGAVGGTTNLLAAQIRLEGARLGMLRAIGATLSQPATAPSSRAGGALPVSFEASQPLPPALREELARESGLALLLVLAGFAGLAALMLAVTPRALVSPADALTARPWRTLLVGVLTAVHFLLIPLGTIAVALLVGFLWDWFLAVLLVLLVCGAFGMLAYLSPLITGIWAGRWLNRALGRAADSRPVLVLGVVLVALLGHLPRLGLLIYLASFVLAVGAVAVAGARASAPGGRGRTAPDAAGQHEGALPSAGPSPSD